MDELTTVWKFLWESSIVSGKLFIAGFFDYEAKPAIGAIVPGRVFTDVFGYRQGRPENLWARYSMQSARNIQQQMEGESKLPITSLPGLHTDPKLDSTHKHLLEISETS